MIHIREHLVGSDILKTSVAEDSLFISQHFIVKLLCCFEITPGLINTGYSRKYVIILFIIFFLVRICSYFIQYIKSFIIIAFGKTQRTNGLIEFTFIPGSKNGRWMSASEFS